MCTLWHHLTICGLETEVYEQEGYDLVGAAFEVYNELGFGMAEEIYQQSLEIELDLRKIPFRSKEGLRVRYKNRLLTTVYRPDLLVSSQVIVELKAAKQLSSEHESQVFNYMRVSGKKVGYLMNFGSPDKLEWKRFVL